MLQLIPKGDCHRKIHGPQDFWVISGYQKNNHQGPNKQQDEINLKLFINVHYIHVILMVVSLWVGVGHCSTEIPWQDFSGEAHGGNKLTSYPRIKESI